MSKVSAIEFHDMPSRAGVCGCNRGPSNLSHVISHFLLCKSQTTGPARDLLRLSDLSSCLKEECVPVPFLTDYLTLHELFLNELREYTGKKTVEHTAVVYIQ